MMTIFCRISPTILWKQCSAFSSKRCIQKRTSNRQNISHKHKLRNSLRVSSCPLVFCSWVNVATRKVLAFLLLVSTCTAMDWLRFSQPLPSANTRANKARCIGSLSWHQTYRTLNVQWHGLVCGFFFAWLIAHLADFFVKIVFEFYFSGSTTSGCIANGSQLLQVDPGWACQATVLL